MFILGGQGPNARWPHQDDPGRYWLRTRREWVEQYVPTKTIKPPHPEVVELPPPRGGRHVNAGIKLKNGGMGNEFLQERAESAKKC